MTWDVLASETTEDRLLSWKRVKELTSLSRTTAWRLQKAGDFPQPVAISPGRVGWREREVAAWKASRRPRATAPDAQPSPAGGAAAPRPPAGPPVAAAPSTPATARRAGTGRAQQMRLDF